MSDPHREQPYFARSIDLRDSPRTLDPLTRFALVFDDAQMWVGTASWCVAFPSLWGVVVRPGESTRALYLLVVGGLLLLFALWNFRGAVRSALRRLDLVCRGQLLYADLVERSLKRVSKGPDWHVFRFEVEPPADVAQGYRQVAAPPKFRFEIEVENPEGLGDEPREPVLFHPDYLEHGLALDDRALGLEVLPDGGVRKRRGLYTSLLCVAMFVGAVPYGILEAAR